MRDIEISAPSTELVLGLVSGIVTRIWGVKRSLGVVINRVVVGFLVYYSSYCVQEVLISST